LLFQFHQILPGSAVDLGYLRQLFARNPAFLGGIGFDEAAVHRQMLALNQSCFRAASDHFFKELPEQI
jgi:hypothetical protein